MFIGFWYSGNAAKAIAETALEGLEEIAEEEDAVEQFSEFNFTTTGEVDECGFLVFKGKMLPLQNVTFNVSRRRIECTIECELAIDGNKSYATETASMAPTPKMLALFGL